MLDEVRGIFLHFQLVGRKKKPSRGLKTFVQREGRQPEAILVKRKSSVAGCRTKEKYVGGKRRGEWVWWVGSGYAVSKAKAKGLLLVGHIELVWYARVWCTSQRKGAENIMKNKHKYRQYSLSAYHMLGLGLNALHTWPCLIIPTCGCKR